MPQAKFRHAARTYPSAYEPVTMLALAPPAGAPPLLTPISEPLELGTVPVCVMPSLRSYTDVNRQSSFLEMLFPTGDLYPRERETGYAARDGTYLYKTPGDRADRPAQIRRGYVMAGGRVVA